jgi:acyl-coenzyme A synthetase/AMP-(fatty) acid ligase
MWLGIGDAIAYWARYKPKEIALRTGSRIYDYGSLYERAYTISTFITESNLEGRFGLGLNDKYEYLACIAGLNLLGKPIIILNPNVDRESLKVHLTDTIPCAIIGHSDLIDLVNLDRNTNIRTIKVSDIPCVKKTIPLFRTESKEWGILFSSGSTGIPKAIIYDHLAMTSELLAWCLELGIRRKTKFYIGRPIYYTGGLVLALATLLVGGEVILPEYQIDNDFEAIWEHYQKCLEDLTIDYAFFVPDQIRTFVKIAKAPVGGTTILVMGAPITDLEKQDASIKLKSPIIESWGNSEGLGTITEEEDLHIRPSSIGRPFLTEKIYVVTDDLAECKPGEKGRLAGSEETMFVEYANRPDATKCVKKNNIVLSDDIGYMDDDGYFYICGRAQESFVVKGETVFLPEMEERIRKIPIVNDICLVALEADKTAHFYALVVSGETNAKDVLKIKINEALGMQLSGFLFVDDLPRLASGKIDRLAASKLVQHSI